jgi:hypothetical protein
MKSKVFLLIFLRIYFSSSSEFPSKIPESACKIVSEVIEKETWMKTIAIVKFSNVFDEKEIDILMNCLPAKITVVVIDIGTYNSDASLQNPTFIIMIIDLPTELITVSILKFN